MKKYKCDDCTEIYEKTSEYGIYCPKCYSNSVKLIENIEQEKTAFDIEDLLNSQYGCRGSCSCS